MPYSLTDRVTLKDRATQLEVRVELSKRNTTWILNRHENVNKHEKKRPKLWWESIVKDHYVDISIYWHLLTCIDAKQNMSSIKYKIKVFKGVRIRMQERKVSVEMRWEMRQSRPVSLTESGDAKIKVEYVEYVSRACSMYSKVLEKAYGRRLVRSLVRRL